MERKSGLPMVKLFRDKETGAQEAEVVLDDPRSATGIVSWFNGIVKLLPVTTAKSLKVFVVVIFGSN